VAMRIERTILRVLHRGDAFADGGQHEHAPCWLLLADEI